MKLVSSEKLIRSRSGNWQSQDTGTPVPATKGAPLSVRKERKIFAAISDRWLQNNSEDCSEFKVTGPLAVSIRRFIKWLPVERILLAVDTTFSRIGNRSEHDRHKYFCAVCWKMIRGEFTDPARPAVNGPASSPSDNRDACKVLA